MFIDIHTHRQALYLYTIILYSPETLYTHSLLSVCLVCTIYTNALCLFAGHFDLRAMFTVLRDQKSGICMSDGMFVSTSSQVVPPSPHL